MAQLYAQHKIKTVPNSTFIDQFHKQNHNDVVTFLNEFIRYYKEIQALVPGKLMEWLNILLRNGQDMQMLISESITHLLV